MSRALPLAGLALGLGAALAPPAAAEIAGNAAACAHVVDSAPWPNHAGMYLTVIGNSCFQAVKVTVCAEDKWCEIEVIEYPGGPKVAATKGKPSKITAVFTKTLRTD